ncbi:MAG: ABC transporter permease subunit [Chloroflexi bacterium]|jgi:ABC-2 type transport system permease protein|nr:ABC transporter permease subunit [Chloroflexota bacterium]
MWFIYKLTLRQLSGRWRLLITLLLTALPVVMGVIRSLVEDGPPDAEFQTGVVGMLVGVIMPLVVLAIASAAFTNEIEDRTLANLTLTPIPRWKIIVPKLLGAISVAAPMIATSALIAGYFIYEGDVKAILSTTVGAVVGVVLYSTVFTWAGIMTTRAIGFGLLYVFLWEVMLSGIVPGVRFLSLNHYSVSVMRAIDERRFTGEDMLSSGVAVGASFGVLVIFLLLSIRRLRRMDVP